MPVSTVPSLVVHSSKSDGLFRLILTGRQEDALKKVADSCETETRVITASLSSKDEVLVDFPDQLGLKATIGALQISSLAEKALGAFSGRLDYLVNNAGVIEKGALADSDEAQLERILQTNLNSVYQLTRLCLPAIKANKAMLALPLPGIDPLKGCRPQGSIVNVSSVNGMRAFPGLVAYNVSKAGLDQFTRCLALELAPDGVSSSSLRLEGLFSQASSPIVARCG